MGFTEEFKKVEKYERLQEELYGVSKRKREIEKDTKQLVEDINFLTKQITFKKVKPFSNEEYYKRMIDYQIFKAKINVEKHMRILNRKIDMFIEQLTPLYEKAREEASEFYKKYYVFTSEEIIDAFKRACSIYGRRKPIVEIDTSTYIAHSKEEGPKNKRTLNDFKAETAKRHGKDYKFENDFGYGYKVYLKIYWKNRYDFLYLLPLDFNMKMADNTTLEENLTTKVTNNYSEKTNYYTELQVKPSAYGKFIVPLDFTIIPTDRSESLTPIDGEVVKRVYEILTNKLRVRELVNKGELKEEIEVL